MNRMQRMPGMRRKPGKKYTFLNVVIILLSVVLAISILITIYAVRDTSTVYYDNESSLQYMLTDKQYVRIAERYDLIAIGHPDAGPIRKLSEYYAVGRYFEAAFFEHAYETVGLTEKAEALRAKMDAIEAEMGEFAPEKENILKLF